MLNADDVVVRLHDPTDSSTERTAPPSSAHVQLDDVTRTLIQQGVGDEFCQHDGVVTMMMFYRRRASPKHCYDMTEVDYGGGGHHTRLGVSKNFLLRFPKTSWAFPFGPNKVFSYPNILGNIRNPFW